MLHVHVVEYIEHDSHHVYKMSVPDGNIHMHPIQGPTRTYKSTQQHPPAYQHMEAVKTSGHEEDTPEDRIGQTIPKLKVLKSLHPEEAKSTHECKK